VSRLVKWWRRLACALYGHSWDAGIPTPYAPKTRCDVCGEMQT
jgi:hypothetical protein